MNDHLSNALVNWIYNTPPWASTLVFMSVAFALIVITLIPFRLIIRHEYRRRHHEVFSFVVTNIAVLYAVLLAFIAVASWESFSHATELAEAEANLTGNLYRDTDGFGTAPVAAALRTPLRDYVQIVIDKEWLEQKQGREPDQGWPALERFQRTLVGVEPQNLGQSVAMQEMLRTLNELYAARRSRVDASLGHIPAVVWYVILIVGAMTVGFTYLLGVESLWAHLIASGGLGLALVLVVALIVQFDYPFRGSISVGPDAYEKVLANMHRLHPEVFGGQNTNRLHRAASLPMHDLGNYH
jgi:Protein of unknown function (DUF4239)